MNPWEEFAQASPQTMPWDEFASSPKAQSKPQKFGAEAFQDTLRAEAESRPWLERNLAGVGSAVETAWQGIKGVLPGMSTDAQNVKNQSTLADVAPVGNIAGNVAVIGLLSRLFPQSMAGAGSAIASRFPQAAGAIDAIGAAIPAANTYKGTALAGAATGALLSPGDAQERLAQGAMSAAGGVLGMAAGRGIASAVRPDVSPEVKLLQDAGVTPSPGQIIGGAFKTTEEKARSLPIVGDMITRSHKRAGEEFNAAALARAAEGLVDDTGAPLKVTAIGSEGLKQVRQAAGNMYDDLLPKMQADALDPQFVSELANLRSMVSALPDAQRNYFDSVITRELEKRLAPNGVLSGQNLKDATIALREKAGNFTTSTGFDKDLGAALKEAEKSLRELVKRSDPRNAEQLKAIDRAYANMKRIQRAASSVAAEDGVFTPAHLNSAVKALDKSKDKRAFSEGDALMQDLSAAGKKVLAQKYPDSGTAGRGLLAAVAGGAGAAFSPSTLAALLAAAGVYTKPGQKTLEAVLTKRPESAARLADLVRRVPLGVAGSGAALTYE